MTTNALRSSAVRAFVIFSFTASIGIADSPRQTDEAIPSTRGVRLEPVAAQSNSATARRDTREKMVNQPNPISGLRGRIMFHRYTNYDAWDGRLFLYDLGPKRLRCLSDNWAIDHAINGNFSPDGKQVVFMGVPGGQHRGNAWDLYLWTIDSRSGPVNLTKNLGTRDEDPRFAPDGKRIVFKQDGEIRIMDLANRRIHSIPSLSPRAERSMPMFTLDGAHVVYAEGAREDTDLYLIDVATGHRHSLAIEPEIQEYFPVPFDATRFLYVRWASRTDHHDQVWTGSLDGRTRAPLSLNQPGSDSSDPYPIDDRLVAFSSTRPGGKGGYDLYVGDRTSGQSWSLSALGINTAQDELGICYGRPSIQK